MVLVNWSYSAEEWKMFLRASVKGRNIVYRFFHRIVTASLRSVPLVRITPEKVWIGGDQRYFNSARHELRQIDLRNEGSVNVLAITFTREGLCDEIKVPVPKGKLREAIQLQERLHEQTIEQ